MISFRKMTLDDLKFFIDLRNECAEWLDDNTIFSLEECQNWYVKTLPKYYIVSNDDQDIGYFRTSSWDHENQVIWIGCDIHKDFRGMGFSKPAYKQFMDFMTCEYGFEIFNLNVLTINERAINLYRSLGFQCILTEFGAISRGSTKMARMRMTLRNKIPEGKSLDTDYLCEIKTGEGSLFPIYKNWESWHDGYIPKMVYATTLNPGISKGPILHERREGFMTAISGNVVVDCMVYGKIERYVLRDSEGLSALKIPAGTPNLIRNLSQDESAILINLPTPSWHPDDEDTIKFKNWEDYHNWNENGKA